MPLKRKKKIVQMFIGTKICRGRKGRYPLPKSKKEYNAEPFTIKMFSGPTPEPTGPKKPKK